MPGVCLRHTEIPHTSQLFADFVYRFDRLEAFYRHNPWDPESLARSAQAALDGYPDSRRAALVSALAAQNEPGASLELLAKPGTVAVLTGQQVGLFSGPAYTIYKALTAVRYAEVLTAQGIPAVPVFWLATEDHDFPEVNHAWAFNGLHQPVRFEVTAETTGTQPVGDLVVPEYPTRILRQVLAAMPFGDEVTPLVAEAYRDGATLGQAFHSLLKKLLPGRGLLYLCPQKPAIREIAAPLVREAIEAAPLLAERLLARGRELEAASYHTQVHFEAKTSLVFALDGGQRVALKREGETYSANGTRYTGAALAARAATLSPNALLRPVVQDYLLPTAALIGGPAELAYLAQSEVIYRTLNRPMPVVAPRAGFTLVDPRAAKLLERYHLELTDTFDRLEPLEQRIAARLVPAALRQHLATAHAGMSSTLDNLAGELAAFDPTLGAALAKSRTKIEHQLRKIEDKTARETFRRDHRAKEEASYLHSLFYYNQHLQERFYTILPFLAQHGFGLIDTIYESVKLECPDHIVLTV